MINNLVNFRDLGGIVNKEGKRLKNNKFLRSGEVVGLSKDERQLLVNKYKLEKIIDFRSMNELLENPDDDILGVTNIHIDLFKDNKEQVSSMENFQSIKTIEGINELMKNIYKVLISSKESVKGYRRFIDECLSLESGSILIHCFAGKDRTGIGALILLTLLDVDIDEIYKDYLLTNVLRKEANDRLINSSNLDGIEKEIYEVALTVDKSYLDAVIETTSLKYGTFLEYLKQVYNISEDEIEKLKDIFLE